MMPISSLPTITAICPTMPGRETFLKEALRSFHSQIYPAGLLQMLILSEVDQDLRNLDAAGTHRVRLIHLANKLSTGAKRNFGVLSSDTELVVHFDDDDWSHPCRVLRQVHMLMARRCAVVGYDAMLFRDVATGERFRFERSSRTPAIGTSLMYRRDWAVRHPFPEIPIAEDIAFVSEAALHGQLHAGDAGNMMLASIHSGNTSVRQIQNGGYDKV